MAYPNFPQELDSSVNFIDGIVYERAEGGELRKRVLFEGVKREFTIVHILNKDDKETLVQFYLDNKDKSFSFTWAGDETTYTVQFIGPIQCTPLAGNLLWRCIVKLGEV